MRRKNHFSPLSHDPTLTQLPSNTPKHRNNESIVELFSAQSVPQQQSIRYKLSKPEQRSLDEVYLKDKLRERSGPQMQRLNETIDSLAGTGRRKDKLGSKQNKHLPLQNSVEQESEQTLPNIGGLCKKDSSKLMEEIKRVEYKIKALRQEREDANGQRRQLDAIRPFVEIHNQSMLYMQLMMANQQKQAHCHHHCQQGHYTPHAPNYPPPYYSPPPFPPNYPSYPNQSNYPNHPIATQPQQQTFVSQKNQSLRQRLRKGQQKHYNFSKLRKFRIAVIAVYFHLLLPRYANKFTLRRFKWHSQKYLNDSLALRKRIEQQMRERLLGWNMIKISQLVGKNRAEKEVRRVKQTKTAKLIITQQYNGNDNYEFYLGDVELFLFEFLKRMKEEVEEQQGLEEILDYAAQGNLPFAFPIDHYHLLDEIYTMSCHPKRLYWLNNRKVAKALILSCIFIKLITFALFFPIKENEDWKLKMLKVNDLKKDQMIQAEMAAVQMHLSGILLHKYSMQLIEEVMLEENSNSLEMSQEAWPLPQGALCFEGSGDVETAFNEATSRKIRARAKKQSRKNEQLSLQGYKPYKIYDFTYIKNLSEFEHLLQEINKASRYEEHVKETIVDIVDIIYEKQLQLRKQVYQKLKSEVLLQEKRLLSCRVNYSELVMPKRTPAERKIIKEAIQLVRRNRQRQEDGTDEDEEQPRSDDSQP